MSENEQRPPENPYGSQPPTNPYGQPVPSSPREPSAGDDTSSNDASGSSGPQHGYPPPSAPQSDDQSQPQPDYGRPPQDPAPYGQAPQAPYGQAPYGQAPYGESAQGQAPYGGSPYGQTPQPYGQSPQPYGSDPYGAGAYGTRGDQRPGTVTAAGWITIVLGVLGALGNLGLALLFVLGQEFILEGMQEEPGFNDLPPGSVVAVLVAITLVLAVWSAANVLLGVFVLRRSNVARILLVISCALTALLSLLMLAAGGVSAFSLLAAVGVIVLLFVGGASDWFAGRGRAHSGGRPQGPGYGASPHGGSSYGDSSAGGPSSGGSSRDDQGSPYGQDDGPRH